MTRYWFFPLAEIRSARCRLMRAVRLNVDRHRIAAEGLEPIDHPLGDDAFRSAEGIPGDGDLDLFPIPVLLTGAQHREQQ